MISIVIPVYNSENIINKLIKKIEISLKKFKFYEIILVNDNSNDNSWNLIKNLSIKNRKIKGINLAKNFGQHNAVMAGLNYSSGDIIITMDDDLQHPPSAIKKLIKNINNGSDICYTNYLKRKHSLLKIFLSNLSNFISGFLIQKPNSLYLSSFRAMNKKLRNKIILYRSPDIYIDMHILRNAKKIGQININHQKRFSGKSNYTILKLFSLWLNLATYSKINIINYSTIVTIFIKILIFPIILYKKFLIKEKKQFIISEKTF